MPRTPRSENTGDFPHDADESGWAGATPGWYARATRFTRSMAACACTRKASRQPGTRRKISSGTAQVAVRPRSSSVRRCPTVFHGVTSLSSGMISRI